MTEESKTRAELIFERLHVEIFQSFIPHKDLCILMAERDYKECLEHVRNTAAYRNPDSRQEPEHITFAGVMIRPLLIPGTGWLLGPKDEITKIVEMNTIEKAVGLALAKYLLK